MYHVVIKRFVFDYFLPAFLYRDRLRVVYEAYLKQDDVSPDVVAVQIGRMCQAHFDSFRRPPLF